MGKRWIVLQVVQDVLSVSTVVVEVTCYHMPSEANIRNAPRNVMFKEGFWSRDFGVSGYSQLYMCMACWQARGHEVGAMT